MKAALLIAALAFAGGALAGGNAEKGKAKAAEVWARTRDMDAIVVRSNQLRVDTRAFYEHLGYRVIKTQNAFRKSLD